MDKVAGVEELSDGSVNILLGFIERVGTVSGLGVVLVIKVHVLAGVRTVIIHPVVTAFPVFMSEYLHHKNIISFVVYGHREEY